MRNTNFSVGSSLVLLKPDGNHNWVENFLKTRQKSKKKQNKLKITLKVVQKIIEKSPLKIVKKSSDNELKQFSRKLPNKIIHYKMKNVT